MNPLFQRKLFFFRYAVLYAVLYAVFAAVYASTFGYVIQMRAEYAVLDGLVVWIVSGIEGLMLWSILKYGTEGISKPILKTGYYLTVGLLFVGITIGVESVVIYGVTGSEKFAHFLMTIPARSLCLAMVYALFVLYYAYAGHCDDDSDIAPPLPIGALPNAKAIERITIRGSGKIKVINTEEIIYLKSEGDYVSIVTGEGRWLKEQTMKYYEEHLPRENFVRVHRSYMVSVSHISRIEQSGREHRVILRDGTSVRISDTGYKLLKQTLGL